MTSSQVEVDERRQVSDFVNISPHPDSVFPYYHLHRVFSGEDSYTNWNDMDSLGEDENNFETSVLVMDEIADWLKSDGEVYGVTHVRKFQSCDHVSAAQILDLLRPDTSPDVIDGEILEALHLSVALQLLASCYTFVPGSSAEVIPLSQQRPKSTTVSSLKLQSRYRYSPAAGHHARECSENHPWPGLYSGPSLEDRLAEHASARRRLKRDWPQISEREDYYRCSDACHRRVSLNRTDDNQIDYPTLQNLSQNTVLESDWAWGETNPVDASCPNIQWVDGPAHQTKLEKQEETRVSPYSDSSTEETHGFFAKLSCYPIANRHRPQVPFFTRFSFPGLGRSSTILEKQSKPLKSPERGQSPVERQESNLMYRFHPRRTKSDSSITLPQEKSLMTSSGTAGVRCSPGSIVSSIYRPPLIPEIRFQSATTLEHPNWICEYDDLSNDQARLSPFRFPTSDSSPPTPSFLKDQFAWMDDHDDSGMQCVCDYNTKRYIWAPKPHSPRPSSLSFVRRNSDYFRRASVESFEPAPRPRSTPPRSGSYDKAKMPTYDEEDSDDSIDTWAKRKDTLCRGGRGLLPKCSRRTRQDGTEDDDV